MYSFRQKLVVGGVSPPDGFLLATSFAKLQQLVDVCMTLNVKKCGYIAPLKSGGAAYRNGEEVPRVEDYTYFDSYMTGAGIAFTNAN